MKTELQKLIDQYENGSASLPPVLSGLTKEQTLFKPSEKEWSIQEIMMHLIDSETNGSLRIRKAIAEGGDVVGYDQDEWTKNLQYQTDTTSFFDVVILLRIIHERTAALLRRTPEEFFDTKFIVHSENGTMTLKEIFGMYAVHVENHVRQIERVKKQFAEQSK